MKFLRIIILAIIYVIMWTAMYCIIPSIIFIFGGSFLDTVHAAPYIMVMLIGGNFILGFLFYKTIDGNYYTFID